MDCVSIQNNLLKNYIEDVKNNNNIQNNKLVNEKDDLSPFSLSQSLTILEKKDFILDKQNK